MDTATHNLTLRLIDSFSEDSLLANGYIKAVEALC
jgi:hypothetical protein